MRFQGVIAIAALSTILVGCNDDVGSSNRSEKYSPPVTPEEKVTTYSGIFRDKNSTQLTYMSEISSSSGLSNVRTIPDIRFDDDGTDGKTVSSRTNLNRPTNTCGIGKTETLAQKITDCLSKNEKTATWDGKLYATAGESVWKLVTFSETESGTFEIWYDSRTQMLWSDIVSASANWCQASGSDLPQTDVVGVPCASLGKGQSLCTNYDPIELPKVNWRLPTRNDYLQGDLDGLRFVLKFDTSNAWTATTATNATVRKSAWGYNISTANLMAEEMTELRHVRCIGTSNF